MYDSSSTNEVWLPSCLFGTQGDTHRAAKRICRTAWEDGTWESVSDKLELVNFYEQPAWIALNHSDTRMTSPKIRWNLNWIGDEIGALSTEPGQWQRAQALHLDGMSTLWYSLAMLNRDLQGLWDQCPSSSVCAYRDLLSTYVYWLPELIQLRSFLTYDDLRDPELQLDLTWSYMIAACSRKLGVTFNIDHIYKKYDGDLLLALTKLSVIEPDGDRFRISENLQQ